MDKGITADQTYREIVVTYLDGLNKGDEKKVLELFHEEGLVYSPLSGRSKAPDFYSALFKSTRESRTELLELVVDVKARKMALYFNYNWTLRSGKQVSFDCVDLLQMDHNHKILSLRILYDTVDVRPHLS